MLHERRAERGLERRRARRATYSTARIASRFSVIETGRPAARSSCTKPCSTSSTCSPGATARTRHFSTTVRAVDASSLRALAMSRLVLQQHVQRLAEHLGRDLVAAEVQQRAGPVDRLRDRRRLLQVDVADRADDLGDLLRERVVDLGHADPHDLLLALDVGVVDVQEQAAALQRLRQLTRVVRREEHERALLARRSCRARGSTPGSRRAPRAGAPRSRSRRGRPRR